MDYLTKEPFIMGFDNVDKLCWDTIIEKYVSDWFSINTIKRLLKISEARVEGWLPSDGLFHYDSEGRNLVSTRTFLSVASLFISRHIFYAFLHSVQDDFCWRSSCLGRLTNKFLLHSNGIFSVAHIRLSNWCKWSMMLVPSYFNAFFGMLSVPTVLLFSKLLRTLWRLFWWSSQCWCWVDRPNSVEVFALVLFD